MDKVADKFGSRSKKKKKRKKKRLGMIVLFHVWDRKVRQVTPVITTKKRKYHIISGTMLTLPKEISYKKYRIKDLKSGT